MKALFYLNKYFFKYKWRLTLGIAFIFATNLFNVYAPIIIKNAVKEATDLLQNLDDNFDYAVVSETVAWLALSAALMYMLVHLIKGAFLFATRMTIIVMSRYIEYDLKNEVYQHYQKLNLAFYKRNRAGDLMNRISEDVSRVRMYIGPAVMYTLNLVVLFLICIPTMISISPELTLYSLAPLPLMSVAIYYVSSVMNKKSEAMQRQQSRLSTFVQEAFSGIRVLKAYGREPLSREKFEDETLLYRKLTLSEVKVNALFFPVILLLIGLSTTITIYIGGTMYINGTGGVEPDTIVVFIFYINILNWPFASVGWITSLVQRAAASQKRINEFLNTKPDICNTVPEGDPVQGEITFENVSFTYPDTGIQALKNVSFSAKQGETLAIIGRTGSGKSTITHLITRQYEVSSGTVMIDGQPVQTKHLGQLRSSIGYVPQEVFLFSDTIANNIAFGIPAEEREQAKIEEAANNAGIYQNIIDFPEGFETRVGERGITLSGGQKQRVSIARAIIGSPQVLIFDDCLSAVDTETEERILGNLRKIMEHKTTLLISHRVTTVKDAHHILVMDEGKIVEEGTHNELIKKEGPYYGLYRKQLLEEQKANL